MPKTLGELLREVGVEPSARDQYISSIRRPPLRGAYWERPPPPPTPQEQQRQFREALGRERVQGQLQRSEAYDPGIDPNTGMTQAQEALLFHLEPTGAPSLVRSYHSFRDGDMMGGLGHGALGGLAVLGNAAAFAPARQGVAQTARAPMQGALRYEAPSPAPRLPNANGETVRAYRGLMRPYQEGASGRVQWWSASPEEANTYARSDIGANVMPGNLALGRSLEVDAGGANYLRIPVDSLPPDLRAAASLDGRYAHMESNRLARIAREAGYDSVVVRNVRDDLHGATANPGTVYAVFDERAAVSPFGQPARPAPDAGVAGAEQTPRAAAAMAPDGGALGSETAWAPRIGPRGDRNYDFSIDGERYSVIVLPPRSSGGHASVTWTRHLPDGREVFIPPGDTSSKRAVGVLRRVAAALRQDADQFGEAAYGWRAPVSSLDSVYRSMISRMGLPPAYAESAAFPQIRRAPDASTAGAPNGGARGSRPTGNPAPWEEGIFAAGSTDGMPRRAEPFFDPRLTPGQNKAVEMQRNGFSLQEIADEMDTTTGAVSVHLSNARRRGVEVGKFKTREATAQAEVLRLSERQVDGTLLSDAQIAERMRALGYRTTREQVARLRFTLRERGADIPLRPGAPRPPRERGTQPPTAGAGPPGPKQNQKLSARREAGFFMPTRRP